MSADIEPEQADPTQCTGDEGFCPEHGFHQHSLKQPGDAPTCIHPDGYEGECPCPPSCVCCRATAATDQSTNWYEAGCARDCTEHHTYTWGRCALAPESARPEPAISIGRVEMEADGCPGIVLREVPLSAWQGLITAAKWVSRGKSFAFDADPDIAPCYPDATARFALGALHDAGLLDTPDPTTAQTGPTLELREHLAAAVGQAIDDDNLDNLTDFSERLVATILTAIEEHLDIGDAEAWCKTCRRVWDSKHHQCESDAEQRLSKVRDLRSDLREITGARWIAEALDTILDGPLDTAATEATEPHPPIGLTGDRP